MSVNNVVDINSQLESPIDWTEARSFITKRRLELLIVLNKNGRLSQGELASMMHARPSATANLLMKFDGVMPRFLNKEYEGKFCYYTLSNWGRRFLEENPDINIEISQNKANNSSHDKEDEAFFLKAKESLAELEQRQKSEDDWQVIFNDILVYYTRGSKVISDESAESSVRFVNLYLQSLERFRLHQNDKLFNQTLDLLTDSTNRSRVSEFIDNFFEPFSIVLKALEKEGQALRVTTIMESIFSGQQSDAIDKDIRAVGWDTKSFYELKTVALRIKGFLEGATQKDICDYFTALLSNHEILGVLFSKLLLNNESKKPVSEN